MIATKDIMPTPAKMPVVTLMTLLLSLLKKACVQPSNNVGIINTNVHQIFNVNVVKRKTGRVRHPI